MRNLNLSRFYGLLYVRGRFVRKCLLQIAKIGVFHAIRLTLAISILLVTALN